MGKAKRLNVRVIAGEYKGRRLAYPAQRILRPTMDRTRESLFASIQDEIEGAGFADLFCAAGSVGIEALSRGASYVQFVDNHPVVLDFLRRNLTACGISQDRYGVHPAEVFGFLEGGGLDDPATGVVFADPPYEGDFARRLLAHFRSTAYDHVTMLVLEHRGPLASGSLLALDFEGTKRFGDTFLSFWRCKRNRPPAD
jgi:16S rRNA (guanine(966)-N(2))-methyltransferase RsmD